MLNKIWCYKNRGIDLTQLEAFSKEYRLPPVISTILFNRGINNSSQVMSFFKKGLDSVHNPMSMTDMHSACERIEQAINNNEKIVVYGDYDVDGITSTVLLYTFLKSIGADADYYIPDRISEGYGINIMAINRIAKSGARLMITVDCGVTAVGEVEFARTQKLDVIITDHHTCKDELPRAVAVINPKREDSEYPFNALAGVGVAFKLALAVAKHMNKNTTAVFKAYAELAAVGTIADVVSVLDENRIIIERGLDVMRSGKGNPGIRALLEVSGASDKPIDSSTVAFSIAPRINAAGRLGSVDTAAKLLLCESVEEAREYAMLLDNSNKERRRAEQEIFEEAIFALMNDATFDKKKVIVLSGEGWHHGVIGIVAARICERFYKPCILISHENGVGKGSGRSIPGFNLFDALSAVQDTLTTFGGHSQAAGLGINTDSIEDFSAKINKYADSQLSDNDMIPHIEIDCRIKPETVTLECARAIRKLEPFGMDNEKPVFSLIGMRIAAIDTMGQDMRHLRMKLTSGNSVAMCVGFNMAEYAAFFHVGDFVDVAFTMEINTYMNTDSVQLMLKDIKKHSVTKNN